MLNPNIYLSCGVAVMLFALGCSSTNFGGNSEKSHQSTSKPGATPSSCVEGDTVNFSWVGPEKTCIVDQKLTFDFDTKQCAQMKPAAFPCDWEHVISQLKAKDLLTSPVQAAADAGAKLVSCGASPDMSATAKHYHIVVQWVQMAAGTTNNCAYDPSTHHITTGCYTVYGEGELPPAAGDQQSQAQAVYACINDL